MDWEIIQKPFDALTVNELYDVLQLRQIVFVVEQTCIYVDADGRNDKEGHHTLIYDNGNLVAYARMIDTGISFKNEASIGRIITKDSHRGSGLGKVLMDRCMEYMETHFGTNQIRLSAQVYAIHFYNKCGFDAIGEEYMEDDIPHTNMITKSVTDHNFYTEH